jgi:hypothetical protein
VIVLDEQLQDQRILQGVRPVYKGAVCSLPDLAPAYTVVKDDLVPRLMREHRGATFVTINWTDFWQIVEPDPRCSYLCIAIPSSRALELPEFLSLALKHPELRRKQQRCGKVFLVRGGAVSWFERLSGPIHRRPLGS